MVDFFEILELSNGDIVLKKSDDSSDESIVTIQFSAEAKEGLKNHHVEVAHAMIEAGIQKVGELSGSDIEQEIVSTKLKSDTPDMIH